MNNPLLPSPSQFGFKDLEKQEYYSKYVTPREWKKAAADIPFGAGAKSLYVDVTKGTDTNDGESWKTALKTPSKAVDIAEVWTNIFFLAGTYPITSKITVSTPRVSFIGASSASVIFQSAISDEAFEIANSSISVNGIKFDLSGTTAAQVALKVNAGERFSARECEFTRSGDQSCTGVLFHNIVKHALINNCIFESPVHLKLYDCMFTEISYSTIPALTLSALITDSYKNLIYENELASLILWTDTNSNTIFHNNFTTPVIGDSGTDNKYFENFFSDHTNIDNGCGIATEPYTFSTGEDPRPVIHRNGWHGISLASMISNIISILELEAMHESFFFPEDTDETVTFTAGNVANTFSAWTEIVDNNAVTFSSKLASNTGLISSFAIESANTANKVYFAEISYGAGKTVVSRHRFSIAVGQLTPFQTRVRALTIPAGETVYYRMKCETASATCTLNIKYHFH